MLNHKNITAYVLAKILTKIGLTNDNKLKFNNHIKHICRKAGQKKSAFSRELDTLTMIKGKALV